PHDANIRHADDVLLRIRRRPLIDLAQPSREGLRNIGHDASLLTFPVTLVPVSSERFLNSIAIPTPPLRRWRAVRSATRGTESGHRHLPTVIRSRWHPE